MGNLSCMFDDLVTSPLMKTATFRVIESLGFFDFDNNMDLTWLTAQEYFYESLRQETLKHFIISYSYYSCTCIYCARYMCSRKPQSARYIHKNLQMGWLHALFYMK